MKTIFKFNQTRPQKCRKTAGGGPRPSGIVYGVALSRSFAALKLTDSTRLSTL